MQHRTLWAFVSVVVSQPQRVAVAARKDRPTRPRQSHHPRRPSTRQPLAP